MLSLDHWAVRLRLAVRRSSDGLLAIHGISRSGGTRRYIDPHGVLTAVNALSDLAFGIPSPFVA